tara:strand:- start:56 stop:754 length:699 start_codon:yes stop_codon:yes gene_type:complete
VSYLNYDKEDFSFGNLEDKYPTQPISSSKNQIVPIFSTPIFLSSYPENYDNELDWICKQKNRVRDIEAPNNQSEDTFILDRPEMSRVKKFIDSKLKEFVSDIMGYDNEVVITQSWLNKNAKGQFHAEHYHPNSIFSGVWYPKINEQLPPIKFIKGISRDIQCSIRELNHFNSNTFDLPLKKGDLILFSSNLRHMVPPNLSDEERISLSFNTWVKGSIGNEKMLTYLPLDRCV